MSVPIKSVLRALKKDLQRVALMAVEELGLFIVERRAQLAELIMRRHPPTHVFLFNATHVESNAQIVLMTLNFSFWLQVFTALIILP